MTPFSKTTEDKDGYEINKVTYDRTDGTGEDKVTQIKKDGKEVGHQTTHPDGKVNTHGNYDDAAKKLGL